MSAYRIYKPAVPSVLSRVEVCSRAAFAGCAQSEFPFAHYRPGLAVAGM